jgi:hypothetical protein
VAINLHGWLSMNATLVAINLLWLSMNAMRKNRSSLGYAASPNLWEGSPATRIPGSPLIPGTFPPDREPHKDQIDYQIQTQNLTNKVCYCPITAENVLEKKIIRNQMISEGEWL